MTLANEKRKRMRWFLLGLTFVRRAKRDGQCDREGALKWLAFLKLIGGK